jgi:hypothetical protein
MQFISKDIPLVHLNPAQAVFFQIISVPTVAKPKKTLRGLLKELNFYLLSINILANVAQKKWQVSGHAAQEMEQSTQQGARR